MSATQDEWLQLFKLSKLVFSIRRFLLFFQKASASPLCRNSPAPLGMMASFRFSLLDIFVKQPPPEIEQRPIEAACNLLDLSTVTIYLPLTTN